MAANTSVAIPTDRATGTAPEARFFVPATFGDTPDPRPSNTGVRISPHAPSFPVLARNLGTFFWGGENA
jgi:hypothetical protein